MRESNPDDVGFEPTALIKYISSSTSSHKCLQYSPCPGRQTASARPSPVGFRSARSHQHAFGTLLGADPSPTPAAGSAVRLYRSHLGTLVNTASRLAPVLWLLELVDFPSGPRTRNRPTENEERSPRLLVLATRSHLTHLGTLLGEAIPRTP